MKLMLRCSAFLVLLVSVHFAIAQESKEEVLVKGELTLVKRNDLFFLLRKGSNEYIHLTGRYKKTLMREFASCPIVAARAAQDETQVVELVKAYNDCVNVSNPNLAGMPRTVSIGFVGGMDYTTGKFHAGTDENVRYLAASGMQDKALFQGGIDITFKSYKISNFIGLYLGVLHGRNNYRQVTRTRFLDREEVNEHSLNYTELKIPIGLEFSKPTEKTVSSHFRLGLIFPKVLKVTATHPRYEYIEGSVVTSSLPANVVELKRRLMLSAAFGIDWHILKTNRIRMQASWAGGVITAKTQKTEFMVDTRGYFSSLDLMAGFIF